MTAIGLKLPAVDARPKGHLLRVFGMAFALAISVGTALRVRMDRLAKDGHLWLATQREEHCG